MHIALLPMLRICVMDEELKERLIFARKLAGYETATAAAAAMGVPEGTYLGHENGSRGIRKHVAERYAAFFKVKKGWMLTGEGEPRNGANPAVKESLGNDVQHGDKVNGEYDMSPDETELISAFRELSSEGRATALLKIKALAYDEMNSRRPFAKRQA